MLLALIGALAIGLSLGLLGSGGSILTVPVLVYLVGRPEKAGIAESLAVVGVIACSGAIQNAVAKRVDWRSVVLFGLPGMAGTYGGAFLARFVSGLVQITLFAVVMLVAAALMYRGRGGLEEHARRQAGWKLAAEGVGVGMLTGFVGVGGGFLIVPSLVLLAGLPMRVAVGTSLTIITLNAFTGFAKHLDVLADLGLAVRWDLIGLIASVGVVGSVVGGRIGARVPQQRLRQGFAGFLVVMAAFILWRSLPELLG